MMEGGAIIEPGDYIRLDSVPNAQTSTIRDRAIATQDIKAGTTILTSKPSATALLASEKGKRCDHCCSKLRSLNRCKNCAAYFYCDVACQTADWKLRHKKMCKSYNKWVASVGYQRLDEHIKIDMLLLSHLVAEILAQNKLALFDDRRCELRVITSLMKNPYTTLPAGGLCPIPGQHSDEILEDLYSRFSRNNFAMHSHFTSFAHGMYPLASRVFNHSCVPNAAAKYILQKGVPPLMKVIALSDIKEGDEICIPYIDPALIQRRVQILDHTYGFTCACISCKYLRRIGGGLYLPTIKPPPKDPRQAIKLVEVQPLTAQELWDGTKTLPEELKFVFHEEWLTMQTTVYSMYSHDGPPSSALGCGELIMYTYKLIYPPNYPQIGLHCLEQAKTAWNAIVLDTSGKPPSEVSYIPNGEPGLATFVKALREAKRILGIVGEEGDPEGPLYEIGVLEKNLQGLLDEWHIDLVEK